MEDASQASNNLISITIEDYRSNPEAETVTKSATLHHKDENGRTIIILNVIDAGVEIKQGVLVVKSDGSIDDESYMHADALFKMEEYVGEVKKCYDGKLKMGDGSSGYCAIM